MVDALQNGWLGRDPRDPQIPADPVERVPRHSFAAPEWGKARRTDDVTSSDFSRPIGGTVSPTQALTSPAHAGGRRSATSRAADA